MTKYRVVWQDRYHHASAPTASYEAAQSFEEMLRGVAYSSGIQERDSNSGNWRQLGVECEDRVEEVEGPRYAVRGDFVACSIRDAIDAQRAARIEAAD